MLDIRWRRFSDAWLLYEWSTVDCRFFTVFKRPDGYKYKGRLEQDFIVYLGHDPFMDGIGVQSRERRRKQIWRGDDELMFTCIVHELHAEYGVLLEACRAEG